MYTGGDQGIEKEKYQESLSTWNGKVALMNTTDYVEASSNNICTSVYSNFYLNHDNAQYKTTNYWPCKAKNYLYKLAYSQWTLTSVSNINESVFLILNKGSLTFNNTVGFGSVHPVFYLKSAIILSEIGTKLAPYKVV